MTEQASGEEHRSHAPRALRADGRTDPIGGITSTPTLSWKCDDRAGVLAFHLRGWSSPPDTSTPGDVFDLIIPAKSGRVSWPSPALASRDRAWWAVGVVTGGATAWSTPASVEAPLWDEKEWGAEAITHPAWIAPAADTSDALPEVRTSFEVDGDIARARLYLTGAGVVVPELNGVPAIDGQLEPGYSQYGVRTPATAWDITSLVEDGTNVVRFRMGGGIAHVPADRNRYSKFQRGGHPVWVRATIEIEYTDGTRLSVPTDTIWEARLGTTTVSNWYGGETSQLDTDLQWTNAVTVDSTPPLWWRSAPPVTVTEELAPTFVERRPDGSQVVDFGTNVVGRPVLRLDSAKPGQPIRLTPSELLNEDGLPDQRSTGTPIFDEVVPAESNLSWFPQTVYHGGRYLHVQGTGGAVPDNAVSFQVMRTANERVGEFSSSDPFLSRLHTIIDRAVQGNMFSVFTDCPHREKLGWLEQIHYCFAVVARGYDVQAHLADVVRHMVDSQLAEGMIPNIAPEFVAFNTTEWKDDIDAFRSDPNWGRAIVELPLLLYRHYGDRAPLEAAFTPMLRYLDYLESRSSDDLIDFGLGDWIEIDETTPRNMVATHAWATALDAAAEFADIMDSATEALRLRARSREVWSAFADVFHNTTTGEWGSGSQASWALAWSAGGSDDRAKEKILTGLLTAISDSGETITVGETALPSLIRALTDSGNADLLNGIIRRTDVPGYGYQVASGATALTESWQGASARDGAASQNHFMLGVIDEWLVSDIAGLRQAPGSVAWQQVIISPIPLVGVDSATTNFDSPQGRMKVGWKRGENGRILVDVNIPAHVDVFLDLPSGAVLT